MAVEVGGGDSSRIFTQVLAAHTSAPGRSGGYGARQGGSLLHTLSVGRVVAYEHATRQWTIEVDSEGRDTDEAVDAGVDCSLAERRLDSFRWPRRDVDCAARFLLMPWERQATSDGRALAPFSRFDAGWQWLTCYGTWIDGEAMARAPAMGAVTGARAAGVAAARRGRRIDRPGGCSGGARGSAGAAAGGHLINIGQPIKVARPLGRQRL